MKKVILLIVLCLHSYFMIAQTREQSSRIRRKDPALNSRRLPLEKEYKLKGYEDTTHLLYTTIAQCEMNCLEVDESTLRIILKQGLVVLSKSELQAIPKKYAVEYFISKIGYSVVVSPAQTALLVVSFRRITKNIDCKCSAKKE